MKEKKSIDQFEEMLEDDSFWNMDEIDQFVEAHMEKHPCEFPAELDQKVMERIRQEEEKIRSYEYLSEDDREAMCIGKEMLLMREMEEDTETTTENVVVYKKRSKKVIAMVALVAILLFAFYMTGIGETPFILKMMGVDVGEKEMLRVDSEEENANKKALTEEEITEQEIKEIFDTNYVRMEYLPEKTSFLKGFIKENSKEACLLYERENKIIEYQMIFDYRKQSYGYDVEDELISEDIKLFSGVPITIKVYLLPDGSEQRVAQFRYEKTYYVLNGVISEEEFEKILKNLNFF